MASLATRNTTTTGWTEETRNQFHPGDIITAINRKWSGFAPSHLIGMVELVCHVLNEGREACQSHIDADGRIHGFYFNVLPRAAACEPYLREKFPNLAAFSDQCKDEEFEKIFPSIDAAAALVNKIEQLFGKTVVVFPMKKVHRDRIADAQADLIHGLQRSGTQVIHLRVPDDLKSNL